MIVYTCISKKYVLSREEEEVLNRAAGILDNLYAYSKEDGEREKSFGNQEIVWFIFSKRLNSMGNVLIGEKMPPKKQLRRSNSCFIKLDYYSLTMRLTFF